MGQIRTNIYQRTFGVVDGLAMYAARRILASAAARHAARAKPAPKPKRR